jgi:hypothetical protein
MKQNPRPQDWRESKILPMKLLTSPNQMAKSSMRQWYQQRDFTTGAYMMPVAPPVRNTRRFAASKGQKSRLIDFCVHLEIERKLIWPARCQKTGPGTWRIQREETKNEVIWVGQTNDIGSIWRHLQWAVAPSDRRSKEIEKSLSAAPLEWAELLAQLEDFRVYLSWAAAPDSASEPKK